MSTQELWFRNAREAFDDAIRQGRFCDNPNSTLYAGHYMYMGTNESGDLFKHRRTRQYLEPLKVSPKRAYLAVPAKTLSSSPSSSATATTGRQLPASTHFAAARSLGDELKTCRANTFEKR